MSCNFLLFFFYHLALFLFLFTLSGVCLLLTPLYSIGGCFLFGGLERRDVGDLGYTCYYTLYDYSVLIRRIYD